MPLSLPYGRHSHKSSSFVSAFVEVHTPNVLSLSLSLSLALFVCSLSLSLFLVCTFLLFWFLDHLCWPVPGLKQAFIIKQLVDTQTARVSLSVRIGKLTVSQRLHFRTSSSLGSHTVLEQSLQTTSLKEASKGQMA